MFYSQCKGSDGSSQFGLKWLMAILVGLLTMAMLFVQVWACHEFEWRNYRRALAWGMEELTHEVAHIMGFHSGLLVMGNHARRSWVEEQEDYKNRGSLGG